MKELAVVQADKIKAEKLKLSIVHRKDGDTDYVSTLLSELASEVQSYALLFVVIVLKYVFKLV